MGPTSPSTFVLAVVSTPLPGEVTPANQLPAFAKGVEGWLFLRLGSAAKEVRVARARVRPAAGKRPLELCIHLGHPQQAQA